MTLGPAHRSKVGAATLLLSLLFGNAAAAQDRQAVDRIEIPDWMEFGRILASAGDVDGDKCCDFFVGSHREIEFEGTTVGPLRLYSGSDGRILRTFPASDAVAAGVDLDSDGVPDLVAKDYDKAGVPTAGTGETCAWSLGKGTVLYRLPAPSSDSGFGASMAFAGEDLIVIGSPLTNANNVSEAGMIRAFDRKTGKLRWKLGGRVEKQQFGLSLSPIASWDGVRGGFKYENRVLVGTNTDIPNRPSKSGVIVEVDTATGKELRRLEPSPDPGGDTRGFGSAFCGLGRVGLVYGLPDTYRHPVNGLLRGGLVRIESESRLILEQAGWRGVELEAAGDESEFGAALARCGDLDKDGCPEILVGAPGTSVGETYPGGRVIVFSGERLQRLFSVDGRERESLGKVMAGLGDVNSDGVPDILVGMPRATHPGKSSTGRARVLSGKAGGLLFELDASTGVAEFVRRPEKERRERAMHWREGGRLGRSLVVLGDVTGDGVADFAAGAPAATPEGVVGAGAIGVFSGKEGSCLFVVMGGAKDGGLGATLAPAGDGNGDGTPDLLTSARDGTPTDYGSNKTRFLLLSGKDGTVLRAVEEPPAPLTPIVSLGDFDGDGVPEWAARDLLLQVRSGRTGETLVTVPLPPRYKWFGWVLLGGVDFDGDSIPEVVCSFLSPKGKEGGVADLALLSGKTRGILRLWTAMDLGGEVRETGATSPDLDGDGKADLLVMVREGNLESRRVLALSARTEAPFRMIRGSSAEAFGDALVAAGDLDGDGVTEIAIGVPGRNLRGEVGVGAVDLHSGKSGGLLRRVDGKGAEDAFGTALAAPGDLNGDGVPDLLVGAPGTDADPKSLGGVVAVSGKDGAILYRAVLPASR